MKLSVIIPVYNEARTIDTIIKKVQSSPLPNEVTKEIIIVNDGSTDNTPQILEKHTPSSGIKVLHQDQSHGKTAAVCIGIKHAAGDIIIIQDADLEYNPEDYSNLITPIIKQAASVVYGSRFKGTIKKMTWINRFANILSNITFNLLFSTNISDINTCYKVFKQDILKSITIETRNFGFDTEVTTKLIKNGHKIHEVPINYVARSKKEGKKINWGQALEIYWIIFKYRFKSTT
ncbi:MAG: glycosyltransferase family 2 protein [Candidatus Omnitrophica bacterium]|nr:glycosyltransferase family 2 protein [Candidatus Omnitrophota bacterium]